MIQLLDKNRWEEVRAIYIEGLLTRDATFETEAPDWKGWDKSHFPFARLIKLDGELVAGWAALSPVSARRSYAGVAEVSVYVAQLARGRGVGFELLQRLILESEKGGIWTLQASIFPENIASMNLHKRAGFREVGRRERIAKLDNRWRDTVLMERRSQLVGVN